MLFFSCHHHVYELVLKAVFEMKIKQVTASPDIPLFKKLEDNWKNIGPIKMQCYRETLTLQGSPDFETLWSLFAVWVAAHRKRDRPPLQSQQGPAPDDRSPAIEKQWNCSEPTRT
ncbi:hypothetical protein AVEN_203369-1 [Araneus ventricosus]|uniref:Uncharacterized protein n=1 Tax=Araneus ventricosus TaxID=182803 RepID=A0A4Y2W815_ARAVE|nr:hypothetical protein AVEN_203369-1 [Araneus ventricosus]